MKTGIELIFNERKEQIEKHGYTVEKDVVHNGDGQLLDAAKKIISIPPDVTPPYDWNEDVWQYMINKSHKDRLVLSGAWIAAELDRLEALDNER
jgi:hypothetical protein